MYAAELNSSSSQWKSHWFNGGPRLCLGQNLAQYEASAGQSLLYSLCTVSDVVSTVIALIVRKFDVKFAPTYLATTPMCGIPGETTPRYQVSSSPLLPTRCNSIHCSPLDLGLLTALGPELSYTAYARPFEGRHLPTSRGLTDSLPVLFFDLSFLFFDSVVRDIGAQDCN